MNSDVTYTLCDECTREAAYLCTCCGLVICDMCADFHCPTARIPIEDGEK